MTEKRDLASDLAVCEAASKSYKPCLTFEFEAREGWPHAIRRALAAEEQLREEEENHATLQARCYEGFPSCTDGIFEAYKQLQNDVIKIASYEAAEKRNELYPKNNRMRELEDWQRRAVEVLRMVEWSKDDADHCPCCGKYEGNWYPNGKGHAPDCALSALIRDAEGAGV